MSIKIIYKLKNNFIAKIFTYKQKFINKIKTTLICGKKIL